MENFINFYPTPQSLLSSITRGVNFWNMSAILEPSAGKGDIVDFIKDKSTNPVVDCIEINSELRATLKGKKYPVIAEDFLSFTPQYKYDLIIMNPPFDAGAKHLMKALDIQQRGGRVICILNAETLRNPYTNERRELVKKLEDLDAEIDYRKSEFTSAERTTAVDIAVIDVTIPNEAGASFIFDNLKEKYYRNAADTEANEITDKDYITAAVMRFNIEVEAGIKLIREYKALCPFIMDVLNTDDEEKSNYSHPCLSLTLGDKKELSEAAYARAIRRKYWTWLFSDERFTAAMTSKMRNDYSSQIDELVNYDFSVSNIKELQVQVCRSLVSGIEGTIMKLFDDLSFTYSYMPETGNNIHYYNGWTTNKCWYVNKKVVLPKRAWDNIWKKMQVGDYYISDMFTDMEKAFNYLAGCPGASINIYGILQHAEKAGITKDIECRYFTLTFYKKGTVHITFKDEELLKKLNIFGGKGKYMLPPGYGKVKYEDMSEKEKAVVNEFDGGREGYMKIFCQPDKYLVDSKQYLLPATA